MFIFSMIHGNGTPAISAYEDKKGIAAESNKRNCFNWLVLPETLKGLTTEYEELKKESLNDENVKFYIDLMARPSSCYLSHKTKMKRQ